MYDHASQVKQYKGTIECMLYKRMRERVLDAKVLSGNCGRVEVSEEGIGTGHLKWIMDEEYL